MPTLRTDDGVSLYYEEAGSGTPIVFVHEFAGDHRSWEPQLRHFARTHRCIAYNARGYPPSDVPEGAERYQQARQRDDITAVLDALDIGQAHVVGCSMGAFAALHFGLQHGTQGGASRAHSLPLVTALNRPAGQDRRRRRRRPRRLRAWDAHRRCPRRPRHLRRCRTGCGRADSARRRSLRTDRGRRRYRNQPRR